MISRQMINHLFPEMRKQPLPPSQISILVLVDSEENATDLLLNLLLMTFEFWSLQSARRADMRRNVLHVMILVQDVSDTRKVSLEN